MLEVLRIGGQAYAQIGTEGSTGPRLFCLSGDVDARPASTSTSTASRCGEVIDAAGGVRDGEQLKAVLLGGAAGGFVGPDQLDVRADVRGRARGRVHPGIGGRDGVRRGRRSHRRVPAHRAVLPGRVVRPMRAVPRRHRSPGGGAAPPRAGPDARARAGRAALLEDVAQVMRDASICGLGQTAANAVQSAIASLGVFGGGASTLEGDACRSAPRNRSPDGRPCRSSRLAVCHDHGRRRRGPGARGRHDPRCLPREPGRYAHALLRGQPHAGERVPGVRRRGRGLAHPRARLQPRRPKTA